MNNKEIPVYLFTGFLDSGKTTFIQDTLEDPKFNDGQKTLLLVMEDGEVEYEPIRFASSSVKTVMVDDEGTMTEEWFNNTVLLCGAERVVVEYNGMWMLDQFYNNMPENWVVYQEMTFADSRNFVQYNQNMRQLVYDKIKSTETIVFKHMKKEDDKMPLHKIVRQANRRCDIIYEYGPNDIELDTIEDPLPFDINAPVIDIEDKDYALWYADMNENEPNYYNKTVRFRGRTLLGGGLKKDEFVIGRNIMTCCVQDIQFGGLVGKYKDVKSLEHGGWVIMTAKIVKEYNQMYESEGPVFHVKEIVKCDPPEEEVATFY
ncbi:MAG: hypothetical protein IKX81_05435 [Firmicutes bacterium]|nr:hypothetical protein [Bacillota bacterium]